MATAVLHKKIHRKMAEETTAEKPFRVPSGRLTELDRDLQSLFDRLPAVDAQEESFITPIAEEDGFTLTHVQFGVGIRLAVSDVDGSIRACPECGKRRLVTVPGPFAIRELRSQNTITVCADALGSDPCCGFYEKPPARAKQEQRKARTTQ